MDDGSGENGENPPRVLLLARAGGRRTMTSWAYLTALAARGGRSTLED